MQVKTNSIRSINLFLNKLQHLIHLVLHIIRHEQRKVRYKYETINYICTTNPKISIPPNKQIDKNNEKGLAPMKN